MELIMPVAFKVRGHMTISSKWLVHPFEDLVGLVFSLERAVYRSIKGPKLYVLATLFSAKNHETHKALFRLVKINSPSLIRSPQDAAVAVEAAASFVQ